MTNFREELDAGEAVGTFDPLNQYANFKVRTKESRLHSRKTILYVLVGIVALVFHFSHS